MCFYLLNLTNVKLALIVHYYCKLFQSIVVKIMKIDFSNVENNFKSIFF